MKTRLLLLAAFSATLLPAAYVYEMNLSGFPLPPESTLNGSASSVFGMPTVSFSSPGSYISTAAIPATPNDYEINTPIILGTGGGTYVHYLRASSNALAAPGSCAGSYISTEIAVSGTYVATGDPAAAAQLNINQCVSGTLTSLGSSTITVPQSANFRSIIWEQRFGFLSIISGCGRSQFRVQQDFSASAAMD